VVVEEEEDHQAVDSLEEGDRYMAKKKMPPQLVEYFKNKNAKKEDGSKMTDKEKRKAALETAQEYKKQKAEKK
jgi:hypothetical protein